MCKCDLCEGCVVVCMVVSVCGCEVRCVCVVEVWGVCKWRCVR